MSRENTHIHSLEANTEFVTSVGFICTAIVLVSLIASVRGCYLIDAETDRKALESGYEKSAIPGVTYPVWVKAKEGETKP